MSGRWTEAEIMFLKENYEVMDNSEIAEKLGRTEISVKSQAKRVGATKGKRWTEDDDIYLAYFVFGFEDGDRVHDAAEFLNRSHAATIQRIRYLRKRNIDDVPKIRKKWSEKEINFLKEHFHHMTYEDIAERLGRTRFAVASEVAVLGLRKLKSIESSDAEIRRLAEEGCYLSEIATCIGVTPDSLRCYMRRKNIDYKRKDDNSNHPWRKDADVMFVINKQYEDVRE